MINEGKGKSKLSAVLTPTFIIAASITAFFSIASLISPTQLSTVMTSIQTVFALNYGWFAMLIPILCVALLLFLGLSKKYGNIVIGGQDAKPEYSLFSWIAMLFTSSIGMGIIYFGVNEPVYAYFLAPSSTEAASTMEAARKAMGTAMYHWGLSVWAIFSVAGIIMAYFVYKHNRKYLPGDVIEFAFKEKKWARPTGKFVNVLACVCAAMTIAATMGLGSVQITTGVTNVFGIEGTLKTILPYIMLGLLIILCLLASTTKTVGKGMNVIGNINVYMAIGILIFAMVFGPTRYIFEQIVQTFGTFITELIPRNFEMFIFSEDPTYSMTWDVVNNMWWISWTPFMGVFIASISKGRTMKSFSLATMTIPVAFMLLWHCAFGSVALLDIIKGTGEVGANAMTMADMTFFAVLGTLPFSKVTTIFTVVLLVFFLATTVTSAALSLGRMTDKEGKNAAPIRCGVWCILMGAIALTGIFSTTLGGNEALNAIKSLATTLAYPYMFFFILLTTGFLRQLVRDEKENPSILRSKEQIELAELKEKLHLMEKEES